MLKKRTYLGIFILILGIVCIWKSKTDAQNMSSIPMVKNYPKQNYNGGTQTWDICESDNGLVFFANNDGLLVFDGKQYSRHPLPKSTILRSVYFDKGSKRIYVGGQNELGYFVFEKMAHSVLNH
jgi:hypothetical protein